MSKQMFKMEKRSTCIEIKSGSFQEPSKSGSTLKMSANIKVAVRVRPPNARESEANHRIVVEVVDDRMLIFDPKEQVRPFFYQGVQQPNTNFLKRANKELKFIFDQVFPQSASNQDVFETTTKEMLISLMEGYNCSVFVYGATGAGKTFTMIGNEQYPGITYLTMEHLFYMMNTFEREREFDIAVSYIEIYNENVYDLLKPTKKPLQLREDSKFGVIVAGLTLNKIMTARELLNMLENGNRNRTQHPTDANAESSRSHAVFQVYVKMRCKTSSQFKVVKLSMIDLAGSERAAATGCVGERFKEGANINRSLLSLGNCINKLADGHSYIPYRDSKLTRLLKDSLGGNCRTIMIANVSPSSACYEDTYNTLKYAARANKIQLNIKQNIVDAPVRVSQYIKLNEELQKKVKELEAKLALSNIPVIDMSKEKAKQEWRHRINEEEKIFASVETQLLSLMSRQRVLALRHSLRKRAFTHVTELAHRLSTEFMEQISTEEIPRQERAVEHYLKQSKSLETQIISQYNKWIASKKRLQGLLAQALEEFTDLKDFITNVEKNEKLRMLEGKDELNQKLLLIQNYEISAFTNYTSDMPKMLRKLFLTLKGYDQLTPTLINEYMEIIRKAKAAKSISWLDKDPYSDSDDQFFKSVSSLDLDIPSLMTDISEMKCDTSNEDDSNTENDDPTFILRKRKGTPIKLQNETIIIDDSLELFDTTRTLLSAKKVKIERDDINSIENKPINVINPQNLNSTFLWDENNQGVRKINNLKVPPVRGLTDRTNIINTQGTNGYSVKGGRVMKPIVGKAAAFRRVPLQTQNKVAGFGSSLSRDGKPLLHNVHGKQKV